VWQLPRVRAAPQFPFNFVAGEFRKLAPLIHAVGERRPLVAFPDLGGQAAVLRQAEIIDVAGLADWALAHHARNFAAQEDYLVSEGVPTWVDIHGPSGGLQTFPKLMARLRQIGSSLYVARGVSPDQDARCPGGKAAVLALSPADLLLALERDVAQGQAEAGLHRWRCAWAYQPLEVLPNPAQREGLATRLDAEARHAERSGQLLQALRIASLATVLTQGDAHRRRYTESLRTRAFPPPLH
jgi:hypothetical protein